MYPANLKYTENDVWVKKGKGIVVLGITERPLHFVTEITHIDLPEVGEQVDNEMSIAEIDVAGEVIEAISPCEGTISAVNTDLLEDPSLLLRDPYEEGWLVKVKLTEKLDEEELMSPDEYEEFAVQDDDDECVVGQLVAFVSPGPSLAALLALTGVVGEVEGSAR
jgi:glycine cleavage system H protein